MCAIPCILCLIFNLNFSNPFDCNSNNVQCSVIFEHALEFRFVEYDTVLMPNPKVKSDQNAVLPNNKIAEYSFAIVAL